MNTIVRRNGKLIGHNTDYFGFLTMVKASNLTVSGKKVLVLGSGGASNTVVAVLQELGAQVVVISRTGENNYGNLQLHKEAAVIVNTTPVGMYPNTGLSPVDLDHFPKLEGVLDVIYNPARTQLLLDAEKRGLVTMNGLLMLVAQAKEASEWFMETVIEDQIIAAIHRKLQLQMENIILIGMPGSGKSTVGKLLAEKCGKQFMDADKALVSQSGRAIRDIFAQDGEPLFRELETNVLATLGRQSGLVLATGGGCVTQRRNYPLLHQNGTIFCLQRNLDQLPVDGRPLSQATRIEEMYKIRKPLYECFADHMIDNNSSPEAAVDQILMILEGIL